MCSPSIPAAPDPVATAAAQTASNKDTSAYDATLNRYNVNTPLGSQTWSVNGKDPGNGAPLYTQNINLTPTAENTLNQNQSNSNALSKTQGNFLNNIQNLVSSPIDTSKIDSYNQSANDQLKNASNAVYNQQTSMLDPQYAQQKESLAAQLANQGITPGSQAYNNSMDNFARQRDFAYGQARNSATAAGYDVQNQLFNQGNAKLQQLFALHQEPLNEYNAFNSGTQVQEPQFQATASSTTSPTNVLQAYNNAYQGQLNAANAQTGASNSLTSGLFSLGGAALGGPAGSFGAKALSSAFGL